MNATERLRQLLDERGVEWYEPTTKPNKTWFPDSNGINCSARPWSDKLEIKRHGLTPEQAVEATLGPAVPPPEPPDVPYDILIDELRKEGSRMSLEWYEWECPYCRRIGQVNPAKDYKNGETMRMNCPVCGHEVIVLCDYQPAFFAYLPESWSDE